MSQHLIYVEADNEDGFLAAISALQGADGITFAQPFDFGGADNVWTRASTAVAARMRESARERRIAHLHALLKAGRTCFAGVSDGFRDHRCGKPAKGTKTTYDGQTFPVCGIHLRAQYARMFWIG